MSTTLNGIGVGQDAVVAEVLQVLPIVDLPKWSLSSLDAEAESDILNSAVRQVEQELKSNAKNSSGETSEIFEALAELLTDSALMGPAAVQLELGWSAAAAYGIAVNEFCEIFSDDPEFQERAQDLQDLSRRVQAAIAGVNLDLELPSTGNLILVGQDFSPSDTAKFGSNIVGVITVLGGPTSHTSIICRSRGIPALVGAGLAGNLVSGSQVLLDPLGNRAVVDGRIEDATPALSFTAVRDLPRIEVRANIGSVADSKQAKVTSANGVGLLRTELLYLSRKSVPPLEEQISDYAEIFHEAPRGPLTVRTLDPEGDKRVAFLPLPSSNEIKNYRVLELHREFLELQLQAIAVAGEQTGREIWVMAPQIGSAQEALDFAALAKKFTFSKVGVMVEQLSLIDEIPKLAGKIDFLSVGTNDLAQNIFGINRMTTSNPELLDPWNPRFVETLGKIATSGKAAKLTLSVCGEVAANPAFAIRLAELGYDSVSVAPTAVASVTNALRS